MKPLLLRGHEKPINVVRFNFDGDLFFTGSSDRKVNLWSAFSGERLGSYYCSSAVKSLDVTDDSKYMVSASMTGTIEFWEVLTGKLVGAIKKNAKSKYIELSLGDQYIVVVYEMYATMENEVKIYDFKKVMEEFSRKPEIDDGPDITYKGFSVPGKKLTQVSWGFLNEDLIASSDDGSLINFSLDGNSFNFPLKKILEGKNLKEESIHNGEINAFSISKDFSLLLTAAKDGGKLVDPKNLKILRIFKQEFPMYCSAISPLLVDKTAPKFHGLIGGGIPARMAAKTKQGGFEIHLINLMFEEEIGTIAGHFGPVNSIAFFQDGRGFVSGGEEGITRIFRFDKSYFENKVFE